MNTKTTLIVAALALVVGAYLLFVIRPGQEKTAPEQPKTAAKLLFEPKPEDADRVEVVNRHGERMVFVKKDDDWTALEPVACRAKEYEVKSLIRGVADAEYVKSYAEGDRDRPGDDVTGLNKPIAIVKLSKADKAAAELTVGSRLPTGKGNYVRRGGSNDIFETKSDLSTTFTKRPSTFREQRLLKAELKDVTRVKVEGTQNFELAKSGEDWVIESPTRGRADKSKADSVGRQFTGLYVQEWIEDKPASYKTYRLDQPRLKVTMDTSREIPPKAKPGDPNTQPADTQPTTDAKTYVLLIGGQVDKEAKSYFARLESESTPGVFSISDSVVKQLAPELEDLRDKAIAWPKIDVAKVTKVTAETPTGSASFSKGQDGTWKFEDGTPADTAAVEDLVKAVRDLKATSFPDPTDPLFPTKWDRPRAKISLIQQGQINPATLLVGQESPTGKMVYVRSAAEDVVAAVRSDEAEALLAPAVAYRDRTVLQFPRERAKRLEITRSGGEAVTLAMQQDNKWSLLSPVEADADADAVRNLLQNLSSLRAKRVVGIGEQAKFGLDQPQVTLAVHLLPPAAEPGAKVVGDEPATQPAVGESSTQPAGETGTRPAGQAGTRPAGTERKPPPGMSLEELLAYQKSLPKVATRPGEIVENPKMTEMLEKMIAEKKAREARPATQPAVAATRPSEQGQPLAAATRPAGKEREPPPGMSDEELLAYVKSLPKVATRPGEITQNPLMVELLEKRIAEKKAAQATAAQPAVTAGPVATQPTAQVSPATQPTAGAAVATQPAPPLAPTIHRLRLTQKDGATYCCLEGQDTIFELENKVYEDAASEMHDRQIARFEVADVVELAFHTAVADITLREGGEGEFKCLQDPVLPIDKEKVKDVLNAFRDLKTHRFAAYTADDLARFGLDKDYDRVAIGLREGKRFEVLLSKAGPPDDPDKSRYACLAGARKVFLLKGTQAEKLGQKLEDFEKKEAKPAA